MINVEDRLAELLERWEEAIASGLPVTPEELCRNDPAILDEFRSLLTKLGTVNAVLQATGPLETTAELAGPEDGGRYRVSCYHDRGGQAVIFAAEDTELRRTVALKWMHELSAVDPAERHRFVREAELMARLEHPGVVPVYGLCHDEEGRPYYAMRMIQGSNLGDVAKAFHARTDASPAERNLEFRRLLRSFTAVCTTIAYAHARGVIHRDLKPSNIRIGPFDETIVLDWGLAKQLDSDKSEPSVRAATNGAAPAGDHPEQTYPGTVLGSPAYMSPEQAAGDTQIIGPATDIYGLGATLYVILTGRAPVQAANLAECLQRVRQGDFPRPRSVAADVPRALEAVCLKAMARAPSDRYADARALARDIEQWLADEPVSAYRDPLPVRVRRWLSRHRTLAATVVGVALAVLAASAAFNVALEKKNHELEIARQAEEAAKVRAVAAQATAEANYRQSRAALDNIVDVVVRDSALANNAALFPVRQAVLERAVENARGLLARAPDDAAMRLELAALVMCLGETEASLDRIDDARRKFEESLSLVGEAKKSDSLDAQHLRAAAHFQWAQTYPAGDPPAQKQATLAADELVPLVEQNAAGAGLARFGIKYHPALLLAMATAHASANSPEIAKRRKLADERLAVVAAGAPRDDRYLVESTRFTVWRQAAETAARSSHDPKEIESANRSAAEAAERLVAIAPESPLAQWFALDARGMQALDMLRTTRAAEGKSILTEVCDKQEKLLPQLESQSTSLSAAWQTVGAHSGAEPFGPGDVATFRLPLAARLLRLAEVMLLAGEEYQPTIARVERHLDAIGDLSAVEPYRAAEVIRLRLFIAETYLNPASPAAGRRRVQALADALELLAPKLAGYPELDAMRAQANVMLAEVSPSAEAETHLIEAENARRRIDKPDAPFDVKLVCIRIAMHRSELLAQKTPVSLDEVQAAAADVKRLWAELRVERPEINQDFRLQRATQALVLATFEATGPLLKKTPLPKQELAKLCAPAITALKFWRTHAGRLLPGEEEALKALEATAGDETNP